MDFGGVVDNHANHEHGHWARLNLDARLSGTVCRWGNDARMKAIVKNGSGGLAVEPVGVVLVFAGPHEHGRSDACCPPGKAARNNAEKEVENRGTAQGTAS